MTLGKDFLPRFLSALVVAPLVLLILWMGGLLLLALVGGALLIGTVEWTRITAPAPAVRPLVKAGGTVLVTVLVGCAGMGHLGYGMLVLPVGFLWLLFLAHRSGCRWPWLTAAGAPYLALSLLGVWVLQREPFGRELTVCLVLMVWAVDCGAYFAGRLIGGPKLAPVWSPNKTWAGLLGGMVASGFVGWVWAGYAGAQVPWAALLIGLCVGLVAQAGDLGESVMKRAFNVKDSGQIMPGHGGMLDRIDGLLLALPVFTLFQATLGRSLAWW